MAAHTAAEDRVPWSQLIAFGLGGLIPIALFNIVLQLVPLLGNISLGISAVWPQRHAGVGFRTVCA
jgi:hypothetical protein